MTEEATGGALRSWVESAGDPGGCFPLSKLPYAIYSSDEDPRPRMGAAIGDYIVSLKALADEELLPRAVVLYDSPSLNAFIAAGHKVWRETRTMLLWLLDSRNGRMRDDTQLCAKALLRRADAILHAPFGSVTREPLLVHEHFIFCSTGVFGESSTCEGSESTFLVRSRLKVHGTKGGSYIAHRVDRSDVRLPDISADYPMRVWSASNEARILLEDKDKGDGEGGERSSVGDIFGVVFVAPSVAANHSVGEAAIASWVMPMDALFAPQGIGRFSGTMRSIFTSDLLMNHE